MKRSASKSANNSGYYVVFGFRDGVEFICSVSRKPRFYKTEKNANKAIAQWESVKI